MWRKDGGAKNSQIGTTLVTFWTFKRTLIEDILSCYVYSCFTHCGPLSAGEECSGERDVVLQGSNVKYVYVVPFS